MTFLVPPQKKWHCAQKDLKNRFYPLNNQLHRLMILSHVWKTTVGNKAAFWVLKAVQGGTLFVQVRLPVAKNELNIRKNQLIVELNKHFSTPWITNIKMK